MNKLINLLATGFNVGLSPFAPGTAGSLLALFILWLSMVLGIIDVVNFPLVFIVTVAGIYIANEAQKSYQTEDAPEIVIDEVAGFIVAMMGLEMNMLIPAFILFRVFDILKPEPLDRLQDFEGGVGIVLDDLGAGLIANILLRIIIYFV